MEVTNSTEPVAPVVSTVKPTPAEVPPPSEPPVEEISPADEGKGTVLDVLA